MPEATFACPKCKTAFAIDLGTESLASTCPNCQAFLEAQFYPPFFQETTVGQAAAALVDHSEASCFFHGQKQAVGVCDTCGRLICALCSIDMGKEHICPNCLASGKKKGRLVTLESSRTRYDNIALSMSILGMLSCYFTFILSPIAIYLSIRHWNSPGSLLGSGKIRYVIAIVLAVLTLCCWGVILYIAIFHEKRPHR